MSYSFRVLAATAALAAIAVGEEFDKVVGNQPVHALDRDATVTAAEAFAKMLGEPAEGEEIAISVNGYLSWRGVLGSEEGHTISAANVTIGASLIAKAVAADATGG
jgi:hypothetical protein